MGGFSEFPDFEQYRNELWCVARFIEAERGEVHFGIRAVMRLTEYSSTPEIGEFFLPADAPEFRLSWTADAGIKIRRLDVHTIFRDPLQLDTWGVHEFVKENSILGAMDPICFDQDLQPDASGRDTAE